MNDAYQYIGTDIQLSSVNDIELVSGLTLSQQRILRRLLTPIGAYIFDLTYGAGLPSFIGQPLSKTLFNQISGLISSQMFLETSVAQNPLPTINLSANQENLYCSIQYTSAATGLLEVLSFTVTN